MAHRRDVAIDVGQHLPAFVVAALTRRAVEANLLQMQQLARLTRPVVWLLGASTDLTMRVFGGDPAGPPDDVTDEELRDLIVSPDRSVSRWARG